MLGMGIALPRPHRFGLPSLCFLVYKAANVTPAFLGPRKHRNKTLKLKLLDLP